MTDLDRALAALERDGILLLQDRSLPSLASSIAGEAISGSWWSHPTANRIFDAASGLDDHSDVATFKLVEGKVCFVHRRLWPALVAIGRSREAWQLARLPEDARALLKTVDLEGRVRASGKAAKALEGRLLVASAQVHSASGKHVTELSSWSCFVEDRGVALGTLEVGDAKREIEAAVAAMAAASKARARLPWPRSTAPA